MHCGCGGRGQTRRNSTGREGALAEAFNEGNQFGGQAGKVGQGLMDYDRLERRCPSGGASGRTLGGDAFTLDQENRLVGFAFVLGAIAFDKHAAASVAEAEAGGKGYYNILETTHKTA
jgi:hypothetical protein